MAGGPILWSSAFPADASGRTFPNFYAGGGGNGAPHDEGLGVAGSIAANVAWELRFPMPPSIPTGTLKLRLLALAGVTSGAVQFKVFDAGVSPNASPSAATLTQETSASWVSNPAAAGGLSSGVYSLTWAAGYTDKYIEMKIPLTIAISGNQMLVMELQFQTTNFTMTSTTTWIPSIIWE